MSRLETRVRRLETERLPGVPPPIILAPGNGPEFDCQIAQAIATGARVLVAHPDWAPGRHERVDDVDHTSSINAALEYCIAMPSRQGRRSMLDDVIQDIQGTCIRPKQFARRI